MSTVPEYVPRILTYERDLIINKIRNNKEQWDSNNDKNIILINDDDVMMILMIETFDNKQ